MMNKSLTEIIAERQQAWREYCEAKPEEKWVKFLRWQRLNQSHVSKSPQVRQMQAANRAVGLNMENAFEEVIKGFPLNRKMSDYEIKSFVDKVVEKLVGEMKKELHRSITSSFEHGRQVAAQEFGVDIGKPSIRQMEIVEKIMQAPVQDVALQKLGDGVWDSFKDIVLDEYKKGKLDPRKLSIRMIDEVGWQHRAAIDRIASASAWKAWTSGRMAGYRDSEIKRGEKFLYRFGTVEDKRTCDTCTEITNLTRQGVTMDDMHDIIIAVSKKYNKGWEPDAGGGWPMPHIGCRHVIYRSLKAERGELQKSGDLLFKVWVPFRGPLGGKGWMNTVTGDVRYQKNAPGYNATLLDEEDNKRLWQQLEDVKVGSQATGSRGGLPSYSFIPLETVLSRYNRYLMSLENSLTVMANESMSTGLSSEQIQALQERKENILKTVSDSISKEVYKHYKQFEHVPANDPNGHPEFSPVPNGFMPILKGGDAVVEPIDLTQWIDEERMDNAPGYSNEDFLETNPVFWNDGMLDSQRIENWDSVLYYELGRSKERLATLIQYDIVSDSAIDNLDEFKEIVKHAFESDAPNESEMEDLRAKFINGIVNDAFDMAFGSGHFDDEGFSDEIISDIERVLTHNRLLGVEPMMRMPTDALLRVIKDGRIKCQHETSRSRGFNSPKHRYETEYELFDYGTNGDRPINHYPKYGFLDTDLHGVSSMASSGYGENVIVLKKDVLARTTYTIGDSLDGSVYPAPYYDDSTGKVGVNFGAVTHRPMDGLKNIFYTEYFESDGLPELEDIVFGSSTRDEMVDGLSKFVKAQMLNKVADEVEGGYSTYTEAQYHGDLTLDDIDTIYIDERDSMTANTLKYLLQQKGVQYDTL